MARNRRSEQINNRIAFDLATSPSQMLRLDFDVLPGTTSMCKHVALYQAMKNRGLEVSTRKDRSAIRVWLRVPVGRMKLQELSSKVAAERILYVDEPYEDEWEDQSEPEQEWADEDEDPDLLDRLDERAREAALLAKIAAGYFHGCAKRITVGGNRPLERVR